MIIKNKVWRGNSKGAGFVKIPKSNGFSHKDFVKVEIIRRGKVLDNFHASISSLKGNLGFYIPQKICLSHGILGETLRFNVKKIKGFYSSLGSDGRLYIPSNIAEREQLKDGDLILVEGKLDNHIRRKLCKLKLRQRVDGRREYFCFFSSELKNKSGMFNIKRKLVRKRISEPLSSLLDGLNFGFWNRNRISIIHHKSRLDINPNIRINENLVFYMGCYFADGTKKNVWAITASTFEQAVFYKRMHESLILNPEYGSSYISITLKKRIAEKKIKNLWKNFTGLEVNKVRQRISHSNARNINEYGSFVFGDNRRVTLIYYQRLLDYLIKYIIKKKDKKLAMEFICGVFEGDGSPSATKRGYILIASNEKEYQILDKILKISGLDYKIQKFEKVTIRVNALGLLSQMEFLSDKIFKYYPKRRRRFIERFSRVGAVRFILGKQNYASSWVKTWMVKENILDKNYKLTKKGRKIKEALLKMVKGVNKSKN